ncbi:Bug family tripartite tricarboxylate transporter substrate binding protein [Kocuria rosea]|uniref:Bug family tripartite tricarboxylate transporter substrate binding protein n=1 Tax=Kocuria rosea TaxID=1275 RepID=UPI00203C58B4|nr:tripartite tricarboxylate transporter substrate-binding protein [Kocuria rosea]MCM3688992.1 tripartite tricarboxylate transporter substrate-binding protein [Kocuria rosea]
MTEPVQDPRPEIPSGEVEDQRPDPPAPQRRTVLAAVAGFGVLGLVATVLGGDILNPPATTTDGDYAGETLSLLIPLAEGGGTDTWARFIGAEMTEHIPGQPGFSPVNEAGGEGITGSNQFVTSAEPDGTELLVSTATTVVPWLLEREAVHYSFDELEPVLVNGTGGVIYARTDAGVQGVEDLVDRDTPLEFGGITATGLDITTLIAFDLLDADVTATFGFEGRGPVNLALQRGEIDLDYQTTTSYESAVEGMVEDGDAVVLASFGQLNEAGEVVRDPNFPDVPTVAEAYEQLHGQAPSGPEFEAYKTVLGLTYTYQKGLWAPKDTPPEALALLRESARKMAADTAFLEEAEEILGGYPLESGDDVAAQVQEAYTVSDDTVTYIRDLLQRSYDITVH